MLSDFVGAASDDDEAAGAAEEEVEDEVVKVEDEDEDEVFGADDFFVSERSSRRCPRQREKRTLSSLDGVSAERLAERVHALVAECNGILSDDQRRRFETRYPGWYAQLQSGFSLLIHGLGSKKVPRR